MTPHDWFELVQTIVTAAASLVAVWLAAWLRNRHIRNRHTGDADHQQDDLDDDSNSAQGNSGSASSPGIDGTATSINVEDSSFGANRTVKIGTTVTWSNKDSDAHTVTSGKREMPDGKFDLQLPKGGEVSWKFATRGVYYYFCKLHSSMNGTITVTS